MGVFKDFFYYVSDIHSSPLRHWQRPPITTPTL